jgi:hypothetical protein
MSSGYARDHVRILLFTGKGGVGTTTVAAATAVGKGESLGGRQRGVHGAQPVSVHHIPLVGSVIRPDLRVGLGPTIALICDDNPLCGEFGSDWSDKWPAGTEPPTLCLRRGGPRVDAGSDVDHLDGMSAVIRD